MDPAQLDEICTARIGSPGGYLNGCDGYGGILHDLHPELVYEGRQSYGSNPADLSQLAMDPEQQKVIELDGIFLGLGFPTHYMRLASWDGVTLRAGNPWTGNVEAYDANWARRAITGIEAYRLPGFGGGVQPVMDKIAGLDSSFFRPSAQIALAAKAAGVQLWCGYLASRPDVGLAAPWTQTDFENARLCGSTPIAYCSGNDDPAACKQMAAAWNVRLCLDVENGIRGDGPWVQSWLDQSGAGVYGNAPVHNGRRAAFFILAGYPGSDPGTTWNGPRPPGPCGWQWAGSHTEFGGSVDRGWFDPWFADLPTEAPNDMTALYRSPDGRIFTPLVFARYVDEPTSIGELENIEGRKEVVNIGQYTADRVVEVKGIPKNESRPPLDFWKMQTDTAAAVDRLTQLQTALEKLTQPAVDIAALAKAIVDQIPHNANEQVIAELVVAKLGEKLKTAPPGP